MLRSKSSPVPRRPAAVARDYGRTQPRQRPRCRAAAARSCRAPGAGRRSVRPPPRDVAARSLPRRGGHPRSGARGRSAGEATRATAVSRSVGLSVPAASESSHQTYSGHGRACRKASSSPSAAGRSTRAARRVAALHFVPDGFRDRGRAVREERRAVEDLRRNRGTAAVRRARIGSVPCGRSGCTNYGLRGERSRTQRSAASLVRACIAQRGRRLCPPCPAADDGRRENPAAVIAAVPAAEHEREGGRAASAPPRRQRSNEPGDRDRDEEHRVEELSPASPAGRRRGTAGPGHHEAGPKAAARGSSLRERRHDERRATGDHEPGEVETRARAA